MQIATSLLLIEPNVDRLMRVIALQKFVDLAKGSFEDKQPELE